VLADVLSFSYFFFLEYRFVAKPSNSCSGGASAAMQQRFFILQCVIVYWYCILVLTGVETLTDYRFKYGRNPLLELPLAVNPTGCARTEPKLRNQFLWKRPHTQRTGSSSRPIFVPTATAAGEAACPYSKQFVHSKSSQYKKMKQEWRNNVYLAMYRITYWFTVQKDVARVEQYCLPYQVPY
jgi:hypothetical protein